MTPILYKPKEAAAILRISTETVRRRIRSGEIKVVRIGGITRVPDSEIERLTTVKEVSDEARRIYYS